MKIRIFYLLLLPTSALLFSCNEPNNEILEELKSVDSVVISVIPENRKDETQLKTIPVPEESKGLTKNEPESNFEKIVGKRGNISSPGENDVNYEYFCIDAATGDTIRYDQTVSPSMISENRFSDKKGRLITGKSDVQSNLKKNLRSTLARKNFQHYY